LQIAVVTKLNGLKTNTLGNINQIPKPQVGNSNFPSPRLFNSLCAVCSRLRKPVSACRGIARNANLGKSLIWLFRRPGGLASVGETNTRKPLAWGKPLMFTVCTSLSR